jgi:hypothetical protein
MRLWELFSDLGDEKPAAVKDTIDEKAQDKVCEGVINSSGKKPRVVKREPLRLPLVSSPLAGL